MRTSSTFKPSFWTGESGRKLRGNKPAQVLAAYLMTSPHGTMIGLYYESRVSILHESGLTDEEFDTAMPQISEIALYDEAKGLVYLPNGAEHQMGETLSVRDKKRGAVLSQLKIYRRHPFVSKWIERYYEPYHLAHDGISLPKPPQVSPSDAPSMGHARVVHAPDPRSDPRSGSDPKETGGEGDVAPIVADLQTRARMWVRDPQSASLQYPRPEQWSEMTELNHLVADAFGTEPDTLTGFGKDGRLDPRVDTVLRRWAEGTEQARLRAAIRGASLDELIRTKPTLQSLVTILKDGNAVDKYCRLAKSKSPAAGAKSNAERLSPEAAERRRRYRAGEI